MKRIFPFAVLLISLPVALFSQVQKGDNFGTIDASFIYYHNSELPNGGATNTNNQLNYSLNLGINHFVAKRFSLGSGFLFTTFNGSSKYSDQGDEIETGSSHGISVGLTPSLRYYLSDSSRLNWFIGFKALFGYSWDRYTFTYLPENTDNTFKWQGIEYGGAVSFGSVYFITRNVGLEGQLFYSVKANENKGESSYSKEINQSMGISFGLMFYFSKSGK